MNNNFQRYPQIPLDEKNAEKAAKVFRILAIISIMFLVFSIVFLVTESIENQAKIDEYNQAYSTWYDNWWNHGGDFNAKPDYPALSHVGSALLPLSIALVAIFSTLSSYDKMVKRYNRNIKAQEQQTEPETQTQTQNLEATYCDYCGVRLEPNSNKCENCGAKLKRKKQKLQ